MADQRLSKLKKGELQSLAEHLSLSTDGLRNDIEVRINEYAKKNGGFESLVSTGKLTDSKWIQTLELESAQGSSSAAAAATMGTPSPAKKPVSSGKRPARTPQSQTASSNGTSLFPEWLGFHTPATAIDFLLQHLDKNGYKQFFTDIRDKYKTSDSVVLTMIYVEFCVLIWNQIVWSAAPLFTIPLPQWCGRICHSNAINVRQPLFSGLFERKTFLYPLFYWFIYFVIIPSVFGYAINLSNRAGRLVCPVNMMTFSLVRLFVFYFVAKALTIDGLLSGSPIVTSHRSLTTLFDGAHLPVKLFITTCVSGLMYAFYENHQ
ncbi:hypothetical protein MIR68_008731 [Amoeboaphelidium protococcarum]|nr:hypothetical protein MIR68_008731 [Amoeboaphelidium protococcarum]